MSSNFFKQNQVSESANLAKFAKAIAPTIAQSKMGHGFGAEMVSTESYTAQNLGSQIAASIEANRASIISALATAGLEFSEESFCEKASNPSAIHVHKRMREMKLRAASIAMEAASDPIGYINNRTISEESRKVDATYDFTSGVYAIQVGNQAEAFPRISNEAFEVQTLNSAMPFSVAYNLAISAQDEFTEGFYPTIVLAPDQVGYIAELRLQTVYNGMSHRLPNVIPDADKRNIVEVYRNSTLLRQEAVKVIPWLPKDKAELTTGADFDEYKANFVEEGKVTPKEVMLNNVAVRTAPLVFGRDIDLLAVSQNPTLLKNKTFDESDQLDVANTLARVYVDVAGKVLPISTRNLSRNQFVRTQQGHEKDMTLDFLADEFVLDETTVDIDGAAIPQVKALVDAGYVARLSMSVMGRINLNNAVVNIAPPTLKIVEVREVKTGESIALSDPKVKDLLAAITLTSLGFNLDANRTNSNFRTQGPIVDTDAWSERYVVGIRSPIMHQKPIGMEKDLPTNDDLITVTRARQIHDAMYTLFSYRDTLKAWVNSPANQRPLDEKRRIGNFIGLGKYLVKPFYEHIVIDMSQVVANLESRHKLEDARAAVVTVIQEVVARMYRDSDYFVALDLLEGSSNTRPHVLIGTDAYLTMMLSVQGDNRLLGAGFDHTVVASPLYEMTDKIFITFTRPQKQELDPLSFGNTLFYPELITAVSPYARNGALVNATQVAPRYQHINNLPILVEIDVVNMTALTRHVQTLYTKNADDLVAKHEASAKAHLDNKARFENRVKEAIEAGAGNL